MAQQNKALQAKQNLARRLVEAEASKFIKPLAIQTNDTSKATD